MWMYEEIGRLAGFTAHTSWDSYDSLYSAMALLGRVRNLVLEDN
jgi:hypothetical protein